ncbi:MAG: maltose alpha-D-glucosyltransferase [Candidatus Wallbacteria bacterium]|nr:maltose alpha-D-glucosyltransferase [Candidatus Wallbacteria bacterium]
MKKILHNDPLWYQDAIIYELHVKAFSDSNGDGIGDFRGLTEKLDYLDELGVTALWLLPFYPSPLKDDGYDIADYFGIHKDYGTLKDFRHFLDAAHQRGIKIITELVINHTSIEHDWFQKSRRAKPGSVARDRYVWSDSREKYQDARIIFQDYETSNWTWDPVAGAYYWHRFFSHQPDLNFESPAVRKDLLKVLDFWFEMGVDGMRLDAVPYLFERDGTNCENLPETHDFLKSFRRYVDTHFPNRMLLAEANQWPEDSAAYFGNGDECHMAFHFPVMPRLFMAVRMEDSFPIIDILKSTPPIPETCQWAIFLRNHDELTLEMVTDEERDYMYRIFARDPKAKINVGIRRRLAPLMENDRRKIELLNVLLLSLPGTPVIYYGDEIGMGDNYYLGDRNGVRTPMQWNSDRNSGFSCANPQQLFLPVIIDPEYHYETLNVENQSCNMSSLLWWMKRMIAMRKRHSVFGRGSMQVLHTDNPRVLAFTRSLEGKSMLVVANLSRFPQSARIDLPNHAGRQPIEVFSRKRFHSIPEDGYPVTLSPYGHYWLILTRNADMVELQSGYGIPRLYLSSWQEILEPEGLKMLEEQVLPSFLPGKRWFGGKSREIQSVIVRDHALLPDCRNTFMLLVETSFTDGQSAIFFLPLSFTEKSNSIENPVPSGSTAAELECMDCPGILYDGLDNPECRKSLLLFMSSRRHMKTAKGEFYGSSRIRKGMHPSSGSSRMLQVEQSNNSMVFDNRLICKCYRRPGEGLNPELDILQALTVESGFPHVPAYQGDLSYRTLQGEELNLALVQDFVPGCMDCWELFRDAASRYFDQALAGKPEGLTPPPGKGLLSNPENIDDCSTILPLLGSQITELTFLLGTRVAGLHKALSSLAERPGFSPEPFSLLYQRSLFQTMQSQAAKTLDQFSGLLDSVPEQYLPDAKEVIGSFEAIKKRLKSILDHKLPVVKIRVHGDLHLGQVLFTGRDFMIIDFEGEPARSVGERRIKHSVFKDLAGMIRSFHYAAYSVLFRHGSVRPADAAWLEQWIEPWYRCLSQIFLKAYLKEAGNAPFIPAGQGDLAILMDVFLLEKALYELTYELNNRPDWIGIPLKGICAILKQ